jgi:hypothetical protein
MEDRYELIERFPEIKENPELYFQPWFLLNDERGSYVSDIRDWAKQRGEKGTPLPLRQEKKILWQSRAAGMYVADFAQQANLPVFIDSDGRDQRMWRIASGPQSRSAWFMLFPGVAKMRVAMKKGRALLGIGVDSVEEIQLAQLSDDQAREFVEAGIGIADREAARRRERISALIASESDTSVRAASPGETDPDVRPSVPDTRTTGSESETDSTSPVGMLPGQRDSEMSADAADAGSANVLDLRATPDTPETIVGLEAAADFLGITKDAFEKGRQRRPIHGEFRTGVQPSWRPLDLREWRNQAPRAGGAK